MERILREKQQQIEMPEIDELSQSMPKYENYGIGDTNNKSRGDNYVLSYTKNHFSSMGLRVDDFIEILTIKDGLLYLHGSEKTIPVSKIDWHKALAIIKYYNLGREINAVDLSRIHKGDISSTEYKFTLKLYDADVYITSDREVEPRGLDVLVQYFKGYF